jgi:predicted nucleotidyltransferase
MLNRDFKECVASFNAQGVEYLVVGGYALAAHGHPRYTGDIDLWVQASPANARRVLAALQAFGFGGLNIEQADLLRPDQVIQLGYPPRRIDLLTSIDGVTFEGCWPHRIEVQIDGLVLPVIGLADLKANKRATGRPQDIADLHRLGADDDAPD